MHWRERCVGDELEGRQGQGTGQERTAHVAGGDRGRGKHYLMSLLEEDLGRLHFCLPFGQVEGVVARWKGVRGILDERMSKMLSVFAEMRRSSLLEDLLRPPHFSGSDVRLSGSQCFM